MVYVFNPFTKKLDKTPGQELEATSSPSFASTFVSFGKFQSIQASTVSFSSILASTVSFQSITASNAIFQSILASSVSFSSMFVSTASLLSATIGTINLTGGQIAFPSVQAASDDANTLDDYEEGAWTPGIRFGTGSSGIAYDTRGGYYTKMGNIAFISGYIYLSSKGTSTGNAYITGLPFTVVNNVAGYATPQLYMALVTFANQYIAFLNKNSTEINLQEVTEGGTVTTLTDANLANNSEFVVGGFYRVA